MVYENFSDYGEEMPLFKDSEHYDSKRWVKRQECETERPIQRMLSKHECVLDYDDITLPLQQQLLDWLDSIEFKYEAWMSSPTGLHIHFLTPMVGHEKKKAMVSYISQKIYELFNIANDDNPMSQGIIRAEHSIHPKKGCEKILLRAKIPRLFPMNELTPTVMQKVFEMSSRGAPTGISNSGLKGKKCRTCMNYILSNRFRDCRKRLMFTVASHFVAQKLPKSECLHLTWQWAKQQGGITYSEVYASVNSSNGRVGCHTRHKLLEEVGVDMSDCRWE
jgi:hypothetical protein